VIEGGEIPLIAGNNADRPQPFSRRRASQAVRPVPARRPDTRRVRAGESPAHRAV